DLADLPVPANDQEKRFIAARNLYTQFYNIKSQEARLEKYTIYAPFSGVLTTTQVRPGSVIRAGQLLGTFMATGNYELVATVPLAELNEINVGNKVKLQSDDISGEWTGTVKRISDQIDAGSQTVQVFIGVNGKNLREGMYLSGTVNSKDIPNAYRIDRQLLINNREVYAVRDSLLELKDVELIRLEDQQAVIRGLPEGTQLLANPIPGAYEGMKVAPNPNSAAPDRTTVSMNQ
ncbi:MAG: HlyD family efflux transporter periplasmic adaptor subunit, partial [Bacteroidota bacterium]